MPNVDASQAGPLGGQNEPSQNGHRPDLTFARDQGARPLTPHHLTMLHVDRAISLEMIAEIGYRSMMSGLDLMAVGFDAHPTPGILIPTHPPGAKPGDPRVYAYRSDNPANPKRKYAWQTDVPMRLDSPPRCHAALLDPSIPLWICEGWLKMAALASAGETAVGLIGTWCFGAKVGLDHPINQDWDAIELAGRVVYIPYDSDVRHNPHVALARVQLTRFLQEREPRVIVRWVTLPDAANGGKQGVDDFLAAGGTVADLEAMAEDPKLPDRSRMHAQAAELHLLVDTAWDAVLSSGVVFQRLSNIVAVEADKAGGVDVQGVTDYGLLYRLSEHVSFYKLKLDRATNTLEKISTAPPIGLARVMLAQTRSVPPLRRLLRVPIFRAAGQLIRHAGYDEASGHYLDPLGRPPIVPERPSPEEVAAARELILTAFSSFPLDGDTSRAHAVALMIQPFVRELIDGPTPTFLVTSPTQGSGKGLLTRVALRPSLRCRPSFNPPPDDDAEMRKAITTALLNGADVFLIDNVEGEVSWPSLAAALTTDRWQDRVLGGNTFASGEIAWTWVITGNNPTLSSDLIRRSVLIRLVPVVEKPQFLRPEDFAIPDIEAWVTEHEVDLTEAVLTIVQAWIIDGRRAGPATLGSFESWAAVMGGILATAGVPGFLGNLTELYDTAAAELAAWRTLVEVWWEVYGSKEVTAGQLFQLVEPEGGEGIDVPIRGKDTVARKKSFGVALAKQRDRVYGGRQIVNTGRKSHKSALWRLVVVEKGGEGGEGGDLPSFPKEFPVSPSQGGPKSPPSPPSEDHPHASAAGAAGDPPPARRCAQTRNGRVCGAPIPDDVPGFYCPRHGGRPEAKRKSGLAAMMGEVPDD